MEREPRTVRLPSRFRDYDISEPETQAFVCYICDTSYSTKQALIVHFTSAKHRTKLDTMQAWISESEIAVLELEEEEMPDFSTENDAMEEDDIHPNLNANVFDIDEYYNSTNEEVNVSKQLVCPDAFQNPKAKKLAKICVRNNLTETAQRELLAFLSINFADPMLPTTIYYLGAVKEHYFRRFQIYKTLILENEVYYFKIQEILNFVVQNQANYQPLVWDFEDVIVKTAENHFQLWKELVPEGSKILLVKIFIDEFELTRRRKNKSNGIYMTLSNFRPKDQKSIETKFVIAVLPETKKKHELYYYLYNLVVKPLKILQISGIDYQNVHYGVKIFDFLGDHPGQSLLAGVSGSVASKMPNLLCEADLNGSPCQARNSEEMHFLTLESSAAIVSGVRGTVGPARENLKKFSLLFPPTPLWSLFIENFYWKFGKCQLHLIEEGMASLLLKTFALENGKEWVDTINELHPFFESKVNKITNQTEFKLQASTAEQIGDLLKLSWSIIPPYLDDAETNLLYYLLNIHKICNQYAFRDEDINQLEEFCFKFKNGFVEKYQDSELTSCRRPNFDSLIHFADSIRYLGPPFATDTKYFEMVHLPLKLSKSNNKNIRKTAILCYDQQRRYKTVGNLYPLPVLDFEFKFHLPGCNHVNGHNYKKIQFGNGKILVGDFFQLKWRLPHEEPIRGPIFGVIKRICFCSEQKKLTLEFDDYEIEGRSDRYGTTFLVPKPSCWTSFGEGTTLFWERTMLAKSQNLIYINPFLKEEFRMNL